MSYADAIVDGGPVDGFRFAMTYDDGPESPWTERRRQNQIPEASEFRLAVVALWPNRHLPVRGRRAGSWNLILPMAAVLLLWLFRDLLGLGGGSRDEDPATTLATPSTLELPDPPADPGVVPMVVAGVALLAMVWSGLANYATLPGVSPGSTESWALVRASQ